MFKDIIKIIWALMPVGTSLYKAIKKAKETKEDEKVKDKIRNLDTDAVRRAILGDE